MPRKQKNYHYIYKTTNILNNKFYIGMHSTDNLVDGYMGSGKRLWYSIKKYGKENHICEILEYLSDRTSLKQREEEIVNKELLEDNLCMNLTVGGNGNWEIVNENYPLDRRIINGKKSHTKIKWLRENDEEWREWDSSIRSEAAKLSIKEGRLKPVHVDWTGKHHTQQTKQKISNSKKHQGLGKLNSQYGTCWIYSLEYKKSIKVTKSQLTNYIDVGWVKGRKLKF